MSKDVIRVHLEALHDKQWVNSQASAGCPVLLKCHCFKGIDRQTQAPIDSLPTEIVCEILTTAIETTLPLCDAHRVRKPELAAVCRRWRDIILNTPLLWTYIELSRKWSTTSLLKAHIARSRECPLVIVCHGNCTRSNHYKLFVDILVTTVHRWRSLTMMISDNHHTGCNILTDRFGCTVFPLLTHLSMPGFWRLERPKFLCPEYFPALKHLEASIATFTTNHSPFPFALEELTICDFWVWTSRSLQFLSFQGLKALSFCGYTMKGQIQPDSVHLPLLTRLSFYVSHAEELLRVLSTPSLTHLVYQQQHRETLFTAFNGIPSKWMNVHELMLQLETSDYHARPEDYHVGLTALCFAAPEVRSMEVMAEDLGELLACRPWGVYPIDHWVHLEKFTVIGDVRQLNEKGGHIVPWLKQRRHMGKPVLKLSFLVNGDEADSLDMIVLDDIGQYCDGVDWRVETVSRYKPKGMLLNGVWL